MSRRLSPLGGMVARLASRLDITPAEALALLNLQAVPVYNIEALDLLDRAGWREFRFATAVVAGASPSQVQLFNPATSAVDLILKSYAVRLSVANATYVAWTTAAIGGSVGATNTFGTRDAREAQLLAGAAVTGNAVLAGRNDVALGPIGDFDIIQQVTGYQPPKEDCGDIIIPPGWGVLWHSTVAAALDVRADWEEWPRRTQ